MSIPPPPFTAAPALVVTQPPPPESLESSFVIVVIIVASAVIVSASIYILLRFLSRRFHRSFRTFADDVVSSGQHQHQQQECHREAPPYGSSLLDGLPLFTFGSVTGTLTGGDCAVCLSKFEPHDQLRLLPLCCHAFHAACIDTWIVANQTCPLCRSAVLPSDAELLDKIASADPNPLRSGSFRVEIGSVSRRREGAADGDRRRSYSIGSFEYVLGDSGREVSFGSVDDRHRREASDADKESFVGVPIPEPPGEAVAAEVSGGRNWLRDYVDRIASSRAMSFRSSGRFFSGSSRRSDVVLAAEDLEANRVGEEISELFRWLSGV